MILFVPQLSIGRIALTLEQSQHLKAKRILIDDQEILISDGTYSSYGYLEISKKNTYVHCSSLISLPLRSQSLNLYFGIIKPDRMSWLVEKATELGCDHLIPLWTERSQRSHWNAKTWSRLYNVIISACTQSQQLVPPLLSQPIELKNLTIDINIHQYFYGALNSSSVPHLQYPLEINKFYHLLVGPEGGWGPSDLDIIEPIATAISFPGPVLRTETASIILSSTLKSQMHALSY